ncbi:MAG TPA: hypothetical protein PKJ79_11795, partial [Quisquiliibacterium sp.]|nr:hypothetical protein [Quisquiliibacterium sp.]
CDIRDPRGAAETVVNRSATDDEIEFRHADAPGMKSAGSARSPALTTMEAEHTAETRRRRRTVPDRA